jgi:hypothetical protein
MKPCILLIEDDKDMRELVAATWSTVALMFSAPTTASKARPSHCNTPRSNPARFDAAQGGRAHVLPTLREMSAQQAFPS